jgi:hypothetical protein
MAETGNLSLWNLAVEGEIDLQFSGQDTPLVGDLLTFNGINWRPAPPLTTNLSETLYKTNMMQMIDATIPTTFIDAEMCTASGGDLNWIAASYPGTASDINYTQGLNVTPSGNVYTTVRMAASTVSRPVFDSDGTAAANPTPTTTRGVAIDKYDINGFAFWSVLVSNTGLYTFVNPEYGKFFAHNENTDENHYYGVTSKDYNPAAFIDSSSVSTPIPYTTAPVDTGGGPVGRSELFVVTFDKDGNYLWKVRLLCAQSISLYDNERYYQPDGIAVNHATGDFYTLTYMGYGMQTVRAEDSDGVERVTITPAASVYQYIITKWNSSGFAQWMTRVQGITSNNIRAGIDVDQTTGDLVMLGKTKQLGGTTFYNANGTVGAGPLSSSEYGYVAKWNDSGVFQWYALSYLVSIEDVFVDRTSGNIFTVGLFNNLYGPDFMQPIGTYNTVFYNVNSDGVSIAYSRPSEHYTEPQPAPYMVGISKWDSSGVPQWSTSVGPQNSGKFYSQCGIDYTNNEVYVNFISNANTSRYYGTSQTLQATLTSVNAFATTPPITVKLDGTTGDPIAYVTTYSKNNASDSLAAGWTAIDPVNNVFYVQYFSTTSGSDTLYGQNTDGMESGVTWNAATTNYKAALYQFAISSNVPMCPVFKLPDGMVDGFSKKLVSITGNTYNIDVMGNICSMGSSFGTISNGTPGDPAVLSGNTICMLWNENIQKWYVTNNTGFGLL